MDRKVLFGWLMILWVCIIIIGAIWFVQKISQESKDAKNFCNSIDGTYGRKVIFGAGYYCNGEKITKYSSRTSDLVLWGFQKDGEPYTQINHN